MRTMAEKGLLLALGVALLAMPYAVGSEGAQDISVMGYAGMIAGLLVAASATGLAEWLARGPWAWLPTCAYEMAAAALPSWTVFLPVIAYDAARLTSCVPSVSARTASPTTASGTMPTSTTNTFASRWRDALPYVTLASRWLWLLPLAVSTCHILVTEDSSQPSFAKGAISFMLTVGATVLGFALGARTTHEDSLRRQLRALQDRSRQSARANRLRLADVDEERAQSVRMATLGERTRIAREIHDNVGHLLTRAIMQAQAGRAVADATGDTVAAQGFGALGETLNDAMTMVRRSVHDLEDDGTDFAAQIEAAVHSFEGVSPGFSIRLENDVTSAPAPVSRCFATVIREALSNVVHHSQARTAQVTLRDFPAFWQLVVQDEGPAKPTVGGTSRTGSVNRPGDRLSANELPRGMGLADIESRVRAIGGTALCGPYDGGWRVFVSVPKRAWNHAKVSNDGKAKGTV
ncbi:two-component sensor histidine kinase [Bifidobacterium callitrichidarum]|uniref:histidine kinase n=2 Tax=Bifidobacterium callitrichidarum TaxID=2052941 RepID=A0A2U2NAN6_9BIFI|nr:histidine kinase [Bifidobacterium callitrichidarum]PWG66211.1 two-component sensor histidine kinase [Bifidobacterium callitrichidarum]